ncbi:MAG TPA: hypothetical protein VFU07_05450 [Candidatus Lumbricidophila sp.]|nr:hypothetical protein [Candidatus Lumbricidophila sp.]
MPRIVRPLPRRKASRYPLGTQIELRDGRRFRVVSMTIRSWQPAPSLLPGNEDGEYKTRLVHIWEPTGRYARSTAPVI